MHVKRRLRTRLAIATVGALSLTLLAPGIAAQATPVVQPNAIPGMDAVLRPAKLVALAPGATQVTVKESAHGGTVAVSWSVRSKSGRSEIWARVKRGASWGRAVRISDRRATALRHTTDIDSNGALLVGWYEKRGKKRAVVVRRLSGTKLSARKTFSVKAQDGPYVSAGPMQDAVAWTVKKKGVTRPYVSIDAGAGFKSPTMVGAATTKHSAIKGKLSLNSDGPQVHLVHLVKNTASNRAEASWSVLEPARSNSWQRYSNLGPKQAVTSPHPPFVAVNDNGAAALIFTNRDAVDQVRYPSLFLYHPGRSGRALDRLEEARDIAHPDGDSDTRADIPLRSVQNRRGSLMVSYADSPGMLKRLTAPDGNGFSSREWVADALCAPRTNWFFAWPPDEPEFHCIDDESTPGSLQIQHANVGLQATWRPDPRSRAPLRGKVPDPLVPLLQITEDVAGTKDPVWIVDHTEGGRDPGAPRLKFTRVKQPKVAGTARVGSALRVKAGVWRAQPAKTTYRWYAGKKKIKGKAGTKPRLRLTKKMARKKISVKVAVTRSGYAKQTVKVKLRKKVKPRKR
ncbi:hypothetical protein [Nocardioides gilvus]|uniref:hypothetical protein n=1 Tax=Nocardioides gilvus TaxID=1735589 RepID=UPI000D7410DC|nr:hypothetical protein [Nocardioides gilvus]